MEARAKIAGHAIHQMLIVFPLGLFLTATIFEIIRLAGGGAAWSIVAFWMIGAGIIGGLCAAVFGAIDWLGIPRHTRARRLGLVHGVGNVCVVGLFIVSWLLRRADPGEPSVAAVAFMFVGGALVLVTGWLGGELVIRFGVGIDDGANENAPNSLSRKAGLS